MKRRISRLGWVRDLPDPRDHVYSAPLATLQALPQSVDLQPTFPIYDQGRIGSCTANALAGAVQYDRLKNGQSPDFVPSRLFIYYNERVIEGDPGNDGGAQLRDGIKSLQQQGACPSPNGLTTIRQLHMKEDRSRLAPSLLRIHHKRVTTMRSTM